jgi:hypothetical protein
MLRRLDPRTLLHAEVEKRLGGRELAGDYAEPVGKMPKLADLLWAEEDAALARVVVLEHVEDAAGDRAKPIRGSQLAINLTGRGFGWGQRRELRVLVGREDLDGLGIAEPVAFLPLDRIAKSIAIHLMEEDLLGLVGGLGLDNDGGVLAGVAGETDLPLGHVLSPWERNAP